MSYFSFSHSNAYGTKIDLAKLGQGQPRSMFYLSFVVLQSLMLHTKFQGNFPSSSGEEDFLRL